MKRVGFYGGSFDPFHFGHLNLTLQIKEIHKLDEIWICPTWTSPFKGTTIATPLQRLEMTKLAVEDIPGFSVIDYEIKQEKIAYTIDTIRYLTDTYSHEIQLFLILGDDILPSFHEWKEVKELIKLAPPLIGRRTPHSPQCAQNLQEVVNKGLTHTTLFEISATDIRKRLKSHLYCGHLVPLKVLDYITLHHLY